MSVIMTLRVSGHPDKMEQLAAAAKFRLERRARRRGGDDPRNVIAHDLRETERDGGLPQSVPHNDFDGIHPRRPHLDQRLVGARRGIGDLSVRHHSIITIPREERCPHVDLPIYPEVDWSQY